MSEQNNIPNGQMPQQPIQYQPYAPYQMPQQQIQYRPYVPYQMPPQPVYPPQGQHGYPPQGQQPPVYFVPVPPAPPKPPRELHPAQRKDMVFAILLAVFSILITDFLLWSGIGLGATACSGLIFLSSVGYLWKERRKFTPFAGFVSAAYLVAAVSLTVSDDGTVKFFTLLLMLLLWTVTLLEMMQLRARSAGTAGAIRDVFYAVFVMTFGRVGDVFYAMFHKKGSDGQTKKRKTGSAMLGFACALPLLLIIVSLLISSDAAFEGLLKSLAIDHVIEIFIAVLLGLLLFLLLFGQSFSSRYLHREKVEKKEIRGIEPVVVYAFLGIIVAVYVLYLVSQLAYFFSAFSSLLPKDFTAAEYARRGFFEMTVVCGINLGIIFAAQALCRRKEGKMSLPGRLLLLGICVFSLVLIATSFSKMAMYIDRFGLTRMRILTSVFMVFLTVVFLGVILKLFLKKLPVMKIALIAGTLLLLVTCYADVDRLVAGYNVDAYLTGKHEAIDMQTLDELESDAAVEYILLLCEDPNEEVSQEAKSILWWEMYYGGLIEWEESSETHILTNEPYDWRSYNVVSYKARKLLLENWEMISVAEEFRW